MALDLAIVALFALTAIALGLRSRQKAGQNLEQYFLAGRSVRGWQAGISMAATQFAADTPLLVTGLIATAGIFSLWRLWVYALAFLLLGFVLAPSWRRARVVTDAELSEIRYGRGPASWLRGVKAIYFGTVFNCTVLAMVLLAAVEIAEPFLTWDRWLPSTLFNPLRGAIEWIGFPLARKGAGLDDLWLRSTNNALSIFLIVAVTLSYSATGGLRAVIKTDILQFAIMILATALYAGWVVAELGGLGAMVGRIELEFAQAAPATGLDASQLLAFTAGEAGGLSSALLLVIAVQWLVQMNSDGTGYLAQRSMACRSDRDARQASVVMTLLQILLRSLLWIPIGLGLLLIFPADPGLQGTALQADREATFVRGIAELLPPGLRGLMLTAMLAALASTVDTHLNWGGSYWTRDLYERFLMRGWLKREPGARSLVWVARASSLGILLVSLGIMTQLESIQSAWQASLLLGAGMGVMLLLRWFWWRINAWGELSSIVASMLLAPALLWGLPGEAFEATRLLLMATGSTTAGVIASLWTAAESPEHLLGFYERVRPPGFWSRGLKRAGAPELAGESEQRLGRGLAATGLAGLSVFALLVGLGSWLVQAPPPNWLPDRALFVGACLLLGCALVPVWWKLGFRELEGAPSNRRGKG
ncbi:Na+:solute symporter [Myxococcota bacterium]|nr:Na+:solute symporter [Myxococcota bacterium]